MLYYYATEAAARQGQARGSIYLSSATLVLGQQDVHKRGRPLPEGFKIVLAPKCLPATLAQRMHLVDAITRMRLVSETTAASVPFEKKNSWRGSVLKGEAALAAPKVAASAGLSVVRTPLSVLRWSASAPSAAMALPGIPKKWERCHKRGLSAVRHRALVLGAQ